jgi:lipoyl(octanoyl) transferase
MDLTGSTRMPEWLTTTGLTAYPDAIVATQGQVAGIRAGIARERIWLLEHPPTYTGGTSARPAELLGTPAFPVFATGRGGQWTYHGPGQRIAYVMLDLARPRPGLPARDIRRFVRVLEAWLIDTLALLGVAGERRDGRVGIWVVDPATGAEAKIAAIGVRVTRWVSWHGIALNVAPDLGHFAGIVPCGVVGHGVASLASLRVAASMAMVDAALRQAGEAYFTVGEG